MNKMFDNLIGEKVKIFITNGYQMDGTIIEENGESILVMRDCFENEKCIVMKSAISTISYVDAESDYRTGHSWSDLSFIDEL